ncbi:phosphatase PAP2 family protein [Salinibacterium sp. SYSU T00001]|uniref:bifunctional phosphatase PAP2/diacylglycerol kinase family protein n=1 Tax=Homoserinimonas sedimenticola TaxID=2986805 RepID=UPI0022369108|nr:phosphatase PAP2 family protein [Salinibacterium sedimenticola]MCW4384454.1 phosphatase PAP2 family protein [Salinibacterium sedimenticola]
MLRLAHPFISWRRARVMPRWVRRIDSRVSRAVNGHTHLPELDRSLTRLSHAADRSRLWVAIAVVLYLSGGARRRAAVRGVGSLIVGSALANLVGKRVFGGDRPLLKDVPVPRRLRKHPTSASFPSGHSASAAAFATGVALESTRAGALVAPLAATVAYSRLHTGAHWLSDVVGGAALGAGVAVAGRMLLPAPPHVELTHSGPPAALPALPDGAGALIFVNPHSGIDPRRPDPQTLLREALPAARIHALQEGDDIAQLVREAMGSEHPPRVVGVCGGDGTVSATADVARSVGLPLLVLPGGTFNHFARTAGVPTIEDGIAALQAGRGLRVDVAELRVDDGGAMTVLNAASVGVYPDFVAERETMEKRLGKPVAALIAGVRVLARAPTIDVLVDGRRARVWSVAVAAGENSSASMVPLQRRQLDDGVLDVRVLHAFGRFPRIRGLVALAFGQRASALLDRMPLHSRLATIESFTAREVRVEVVRSDDGAPVFAHDGEVIVGSARNSPRGYTASVKAVPRGLNVYSLGPALEQ